MRKFLCLLLLVTSAYLPANAQECSPSRLPVGSTGRVTPGDANNVRAEPSTDATLVGAIPGGGTFTVEEQARCVDGRLWVRVAADTVVGWTVENANGEYWLEPFDPATMQEECVSTIGVGETGEILSPMGGAVYPEPRISQNTLKLLSVGQTFTVTGSYVCNDNGDIWIPIETEGIIGWILAEGWSGCDFYCSDAYIVPYVRRPMNPLPTPLTDAPVPTPVTLSPDAIAVENASDVTTLQILGDGFLVDYAWKPDESEIAVAGSLDVLIVNPRQMNATPLMLTDHEGTLTAIEYSPDGRYLATADNHGVVILWNTDTYSVEHTLEHDSRITGIAFSPDGTHLGVSTHSEGVSMWSLTEEPTLETVFETTYGGRLQFTPDGQLLLNFTYHSLDALDVTTHTIHFTYVFDCCRSIADWEMRPDGKQVTALVDDMVGDTMQVHFLYRYIWDIETGEVLSAGEFVDAFDLTYAPDGSEFVLNNGDRQQYQSLRQDTMRVGSIEGATSLAYSPDSALLVFATQNGALQLHGRNGYIDTLYGISGRAYNASFSPDGQYIAATGEDNSFRVWEVESRQRIGTVAFERVRSRFVISPDETYILSDEILWDVDTGQPVPNVAFEFVGSGNAVSVDGRWMVADFYIDNHYLRDMVTGEVFRELPATFAGYPTAFSRDGRLGVFVEEHDDNTVSIVILELATGQELQRLDRYYESVFATSLSLNAELLLVNGNTEPSGHSRLYLWDVDNGGLISELPTVGRSALSAVLSADNTKVAWDTSFGEGNDLRFATIVFDRRTEHTITLQPEVPTTDFALNPNGTIIALSGNNGDVLLYNTDTAELIATLSGHAGSVRQIEFSADGTKLFTLSDDGTLRIWGVGE